MSTQCGVNWQNLFNVQGTHYYQFISFKPLMHRHTKKYEYFSCFISLSSPYFIADNLNGYHQHLLFYQNKKKNHRHLPHIYAAISTQNSDWSIWILDTNAYIRVYGFIYSAIGSDEINRFIVYWNDSARNIQNWINNKIHKMQRRHVVYVHNVFMHKFFFFCFLCTYNIQHSDSCHHDTDGAKE